MKRTALFMLIACWAPLALGSAETNKSLWMKMIDSFFEESKVYVDVPQHIADKVRSVLEQSGISYAQSIRVKGINPCLTEAQSELKSAMVMDNNMLVFTASSDRVYILMDDTWFDTLTQEQQEFVITREATKLLANTQKKQLMAAPVLMGVSLASWIALWNQTKSGALLSFNDAPTTTGLLVRTATWLAAAYGISKVINYIANKYNQGYEYQADREAVALLGSADGALSLLDDRVQNGENLTNKPFMPTAQQRLENLKKYITSGAVLAR